MSHHERTIVVTGATGKQGGAVVRHLLRDGWKVRAITRRPESEAAQALAAQGVEVVKGDMGNRADMDRALKGAYGVFSVQNTWEAGVEGEVAQGKNVADAAKAAGVKHFVYTSVGGAERDTGIPHFDSKWELEQYHQALELPVTTIRPVFFMENLTPGMMGPREGTIYIAMPPDVPLQMIATDDIGGIVAMVFADPEAFMGQAIEIAGDAATFPQVAAVLSKASGSPVHYAEQTLEQVGAYSPEMAVMLKWFVDKGYEADIPAVRRLYPELHDFETWARQNAALYR
jgi:uncharacterized protein YbjT (DUF2867 family)